MNSKTYQAIIAVLIVVLIACFVELYTRRHTLHNDMMEGMWIAGDEFCKKADIDGMMVYIGPNIGGLSETRKAFLVMYSDNAVVASKKIELTITGFGSKKIYLEDDSDDDIYIADIMPAELTLEIDIGKGCMTWCDDNNTYAELYKDHISTNSI